MRLEHLLSGEAQNLKDEGKSYILYIGSGVLLLRLSCTTANLKNHFEYSAAYVTKAVEGPGRFAEILRQEMELACRAFSSIAKGRCHRGREGEDRTKPNQIRFQSSRKSVVGVCCLYLGRISFSFIEA